MSSRLLTEPCIFPILYVCLLAFSFCSQISTKFHLVSKGYGGSGQNSDDFNTLSKGNSVLNYMHVMVQSQGILKTSSRKDLDGGAATKSRGEVFGPREHLQTAPSSGGVQGRSTATRWDTTFRRLSRTRAHAFVSMATSSKSMAISSIAARQSLW